MCARVTLFYTVVATKNDAIIRAEFARKNFPQAEMLYTKAVEIRPEDATLHRCVRVHTGLLSYMAGVETHASAVCSITGVCGQHRSVFA